MLTPYNGQLAALNERLSSTCSIWLSKKDKDILDALNTLPQDDWNPIEEKEEPECKITFEMSSMLRLATIDNFQGEEAKIVILSTVRSNIDDKVGFLKTPNRINVACSRAKHGFYIIGNASLMRNVGMWRAIIDLLSGKRKLGRSFHACCSRHPAIKYEIKRRTDFETIPACQHACFSILNCGHLCKQKCHPRCLHDRMPCTDSCKKVFECGHKCDKLCGDPCGECSQDSKTVELACGHEYTMTCAELKLEDEPTCKAKVETVQLPCGHNVDQMCHTKNKPLVCAKQCSTVLPCGHGCSGACSECQEKTCHSSCTGTCGKIGDCGHQCPSPCHAGPCPPCEVLCIRTCEHGKSENKCSTILMPCLKQCFDNSGHPTLCCLPRDRIHSPGPCKRLLRCGHLCASLADEPCSNGCVQCLSGKFTGKFHIVLSCGHGFDVQDLDEHINGQFPANIDVGIFDFNSPFFAIS